MLSSRPVPGLPINWCFDTQVNGGSLRQNIDGGRYIDFSKAEIKGAQFRQPGFTQDQCAAFTKRLAHLGVIAYLPTLITADPDVLEANLKELAKFRKTGIGRHCPGIHLEACFFLPMDGYIGAHPKDYCVAGERNCLELYQRLQKAAKDGIRLMTVGPNVEGIIETIKAARRDGVIVALGHFGPESEFSDGSVLKDQIQAAIDAGASLSTHLGNGTRAMVHRHHGHIGIQMTHPRMAVSLIADGSHLPPHFIHQAIAVNRPSQVWLVSDAAPLEGASPGTYEYWGTTVEVVPHKDDNEKCRIELAGGSGLLAGSWATLPDCMNHLVRLLEAWERQAAGTVNPPHYSIEDICWMACLNPLAALGLMRADFDTLGGRRLSYTDGKFIPV